MTDRILERLAREKRQNELCKLHSDNARLRLAVTPGTACLTPMTPEELRHFGSLPLEFDGLLGSDKGKRTDEVAFTVLQSIVDFAAELRRYMDTIEAKGEPDA